jgi:hypothetical protein
MRPTGLSSGFYKDSVDYGIFCGEWCIGRIYENHSGPESLRWFWALHGVPRTYRDRQDIALQTARFLKSRNPNSTVKLKDLQTGEETIVAFEPGE